jgi:predicted GTPase
VVADPHRAGHELAYFPGGVNLRREDVVVINKVDTASRRDVETIRQNVSLSDPKAAIVETACRVLVFAPEIVNCQRVLVVEDGLTLTHGEMSFGAGIVAARHCGAAERPYAVGSIRETYDRYPHLANLLPAMDYSTAQLHELEETINCAPCDLVLIATPIDLILCRKREPLFHLRQIPETVFGRGDVRHQKTMPICLAVDLCTVLESPLLAVQRPLPV